MAAAGAMLTAIFQPRRRQNRTESGLSEREFRFKSFVITVVGNRIGSPREISIRIGAGGKEKGRGHEKSERASVIREKKAVGVAKFI